MTDDLLEELQPAIPPGYVQMNWMGGFGRQIGPLFEKNNPDGTYSWGFLVSDHHTNGMHNAHGGMLMSFADMAIGHVISQKVHRFWVTVRLLTDFISGAKLGEFVEGTGELVGQEADLFTVRGRIWTGDRTIMTAAGVFKSLGERPNTVRAAWAQAIPRR